MNFFLPSDVEAVGFRERSAARVQARALQVRAVAELQRGREDARVGRRGRGRHDVGDRRQESGLEEEREGWMVDGEGGALACSLRKSNS